MKIKLFAALAALGLFIGVNAHANANDEAQVITDQVLKTLDQEGMLKDLSSQDLNDSQTVIKVMVNDYLKEGYLNLEDNAGQYGIADVAKSLLAGLTAAAKKVVEYAIALVPKIAAGIKKVAPVIISGLKSVATKGFEAVKKYGPKVMKAVIEIGDAVGIGPDVALGLAFAAAMNPQPTFFQALKKEFFNKLAGVDTGLSKDDLLSSTKGKMEVLKETDPALADELAKFLEGGEDTSGELD